MRRFCFLSLGLAALAGCGSDEPVDVAGEYSVAVTNQENQCQTDNWTEGASASDIPVTVAQNASAVTVTIGGPAAVTIAIVLGDNDFTGSVSGNSIEAELENLDQTLQVGTCDYHWMGSIHATLDGDFLEGEIGYFPVTDGVDDCGVLNDCVNVQAFNGTRPPS
jgi:hypothetical protein